MFKRTSWALARSICLAAIAFTLSAPAIADGVVSGVVLDGRTGQPVRNVTVSIEGTEASVRTDLNGIFDVALPEGAYVAVISGEQYEPQRLTNVVVVEGQTANVSAILTSTGKGSDGSLSEEITVQAEAADSTEIALLAERRASAQIVDNIGAIEMSKNTGSDAAGALKRVTGITLQDNKYVYVRGLGDRYSNTQLNGSRIPSTEFEKKVVPLDLFPAELLEKVTVSKSYTSDQPGDFVAGVVRLDTKDFPAHQKVSFGLSGGYNTETTGNTLRSYPGGLSFSGGGGQGLPAGFPDEKVQRYSPFRGSGFSDDELADIGRTLVGNWTPEYRSSARPDQGFKLSYGNSYERLGMVLSATWDQASEDRDEALTFFAASQDQLREIHSYTFEYGVESNKRALMGNFAYRLGNNSQVQLRALQTGTSQAEGRLQEGFFSDINGDIKDRRVKYQEKEIFNLQLSGDHFFSGLGSSGSLLEWRTSSSDAATEENQRQNLYNENQDEFRWRQIGQSGFLFYNDLDDELSDSQADWSTLFASDRSYGGIKFGVSYTDSQRNFDGRRLRFDPRNLRDVDLTDSPEILFSSENIGDAFVIRETTDVTDSYTGAHDVSAAYAQADYSTGNWRFVAGARYEESRQEVITLDRRQDGGTPVTTVLEDNDVLPALSLVYSISDNMALRAGLSRTVNRPEFRELAPFEFAGIAGGFLVVGNPDLRNATIDSVDLRWEWFPSPREVVAASVFYKAFDDPIEEVLIAGAQQTQTYTNAEQATNLGFELEVRRQLGFFGEAFENWMALVNYTFVDSEISINPAETVFTNPTRALTGQADNVLNFVLEWEPESLDATVRLLYNFTDDKIFFAGSFGLPDILEDARDTVDLVWRQGFRNGLSWKGSLKNALDEERTWSQGAGIHRRYSPGTTFGLSLGYSF